MWNFLKLCYNIFNNREIIELASSQPCNLLMKPALYYVFQSKNNESFQLNNNLHDSWSRLNHASFMNRTVDQPTTSLHVPNSFGKKARNTVQDRQNGDHTCENKFLLVKKFVFLSFLWPHTGVLMAAIGNKWWLWDNTLLSCALGQPERLRSRDRSCGIAELFLQAKIYVP